jgi:Glycosyltransferases involved in cell wall biogenesis
LNDRLTVIIPAFNEEKAIQEVLYKLTSLNLDYLHEIIVVDDGSTDDTAEIASQFPVRVIKHTRNRGYGSALKTGINHAETEYVITIDADGQHGVYDIDRLWEKHLDNDMVVGERTGLFHSPFWRVPGKRLLNILANYITRTKIPDLNSGLRLMKRSVVQKYIHVCPSGFSFSTTITIALIFEGYNVEYVPIEVKQRKGKSTVSVRTGIDTILLILRICALFDPLRIFLPASFIIGLLGVAWGLPYAIAHEGITNAALMAIMTSILLLSLGLICDQISQLRLERFK